MMYRDIVNVWELGKWLYVHRKEQYVTYFYITFSTLFVHA
jgi:hypothetical protein